MRQTGLTHLAIDDLKRLLSALHRKTLRCPVGVQALHEAGLSYLQDRVDFLGGLDETAVRAVLVAVIAERQEQAKRASKRAS
jgi:hypothetical protein